MISISKTQNTTLKTAKYTSFAQQHIYLRGFFNDNSIQIPSSLKKFLECFNDLTNSYSVYNIAFDANNNKLYVERVHEYSRQFDLMQFDLTTLEEDKLGYSITVSGANWSKTVKTLNDYLGKEYFIKGRRSAGTCTLMDIFNKAVDFSFMPKGWKTPKLSNCKRIAARTSTLVERRSVIPVLS